MRKRRQYTKDRKTIKNLNSISAECFHSEPVQFNVIPIKLPGNCTFKYFALQLRPTFISEGKLLQSSSAAKREKRATPGGTIHSSQLHIVCKKVVLLNVLSIHIVHAYFFSPKPEPFSSNATVLPWGSYHPTSSTHAAALVFIKIWVQLRTYKGFWKKFTSVLANNISQLRQDSLKMHKFSM